MQWLQEVILDFLEVHGLRQAVALVRAAAKRCLVATPRVLKPGEERLARFYLKLQPDALLLRSSGLLHQLRELGQPGEQYSHYGHNGLWIICMLTFANHIFFWVAFME